MLTTFAKTGAEIWLTLVSLDIAATRIYLSFLMVYHSQTSQHDLREQIRDNRICFAGNSKLKIYGTLSCASGRRMKRENRVFFSTESEAISAGFRPCGNCLRGKYLEWKEQTAT